MFYAITIKYFFLKRITCSVWQCCRPFPTCYIHIEKRNNWKEWAWAASMYSPWNAAVKLVVWEMIKIIISKEFFHFFKALTSKQSLIFTVKLREPWLFHFVCATQNIPINLCCCEFLSRKKCEKGKRYWPQKLCESTLKGFKSNKTRAPWLIEKLKLKKATIFSIVNNPADH